MKPNSTCKFFEPFQAWIMGPSFDILQLPQSLRNLKIGSKFQSRHSATKFVTETQLEHIFAVAYKQKAPIRFSQFLFFQTISTVKDGTFFKQKILNLPR